jgi:hypothetical protein
MAGWHRKGAGGPAIAAKDTSLLDNLQQLLEPATMGEELCGSLGDEVRSGGVMSRHFDDLDAVLKLTRTTFGN